MTERADQFEQSDEPDEAAVAARAPDSTANLTEHEHEAEPAPAGGATPVAPERSAPGQDRG